MSSLTQAGSGALLKHPSFLLFVLSRAFSRFSGQIAAVDALLPQLCQAAADRFRVFR